MIGKQSIESIVTVIILSSATILTQAQGRPQESTLQVAVDLVLRDVTVHDKTGKPITNLEREDFKVYEDKVEQSISFFSKEESAVTWGLVLDRSGSMKGRIQEVYEAAVHMLDEGTTEDEMFIMTFGDEVNLVSKLTSDRRQLQESIFGLHAEGSTPLNDAVVSALDYIKQGKHRKKVLVVITDGSDNHSSTSFSRVVDRVRESDVLIYTVGMYDALEALQTRKGSLDNKHNLEEIAEITGAYAYFPTNMEKCRQTMSNIAREVSEHYTIGYYSSNQTRDGRWRKSRVVIAKLVQDKIKYIVRTRSGYYAPRAEK